MILQRFLMTAATLTAVSFVPFVHPVCAILSFLLMFIRRKQEISNFVCVLLGTTLYSFSCQYDHAVYRLLVYVGLPLVAITAGAKLYARDNYIPDKKK